MKFSIITPEHTADNKPFLEELYESICAQTYDNWEWILYLNNKCTPDDISDKIRKDDRVVISYVNDGETRIGSIKNAAFMKGTGDILVEVDHDDLITPDCLEELKKAYEENPDVGFVYSDSITLHMTDDFVPYDASNGWTYHTVEFQGKERYVMHSFEPSSHSLMYIWFAPDHVRSWRKSIYHELGGHNIELDICDDHELCIRTYLHSKMKRIPKPLYVYRITGNNSWLARNEAIQIKTVELGYQYAQKLAERDAELNNQLKVDIGGGLNPYPNYVSIDLRKDADIVYDLNDGIPLPDNTVGVLNASHIVEHLHDKTKIMSEIYRVLAPGGWAFIEVPSTDGRGAFQDPTHVSYWNENSFLYYTDAYLANFIDNKDIRFQPYRLQTYFPNEWMQNLNVLVTSAWLVAIKGDMPRLPGILKI